MKKEMLTSVWSAQHPSKIYNIPSLVFSYLSIWIDGKSTCFAFPIFIRYILYPEKKMELSPDRL